MKKFMHTGTESNKQAKYKFNSAWLEASVFKGWLAKKEENGSDFAFCKICKLKLNAHKIDLVRHCKSARHTKTSSAIAVAQPINKSWKKSAKTDSKRAEIKLTALLATNDLSFLLMDSMTPLLKSAILDSEIVKKMSLHRTKATGIMKNVLGKYFSNELFSKLKNTYFSLIMDETTDVSGIKQCALTVMYYEEDRVVTRFMDMKECVSGCAVDLVALLKKCITEKNIPFTNFIGFAADTPNVMFGAYNSVSVLLKNESHSIVTIKCSCHMIHLVASKASQLLPVDIEDLLRNLGSHFNRSFLRQDQFREFQKYFQTDIHKILSPSVTRWLSIKSCVDRVLEQFTPLHSYMRLQVFEDPSKTTESMLATMNKSSTKVFLEFMSYSLEILTDFNKTFQTERPILYKLKREVTFIIKQFMSNFIKMEIIKRNDVWAIDYKNSDYFVDLNEVYIGVAAHDSLQNVTESEKLTILKTCRDFYVKSIDEIKEKFDFSDKIYDIINIVDPDYAQSFKIKSLKCFKEYFEFVPVELQNIDNEWKEHALLDHENLGLNSSLEAECYWKKLFEIKNAAGEYKFLNLRKVISILMILPFSNASVERIFSHLKKCKTDIRNKLHTDTIASIMYTKEGVNRAGGSSFEPPEEMYFLNAKD